MWVFDVFEFRAHPYENSVCSLNSGKNLFCLFPLDVLIVDLDPLIPLGYEKISGLIFYAPVPSLQLVICSHEMNFMC